jgi:hypothetical protein
MPSGSFYKVLIYIHSGCAVYGMNCLQTLEMWVRIPLKAWMCLCMLLACEIHTEGTSVGNQSNIGATSSLALVCAQQVISLIINYGCAVMTSGKEKHGISVPVLTTVTLN